jgi:hypothetical protein
MYGVLMELAITVQNGSVLVARDAVAVVVLWHTKEVVLVEFEVDFVGLR